MWGRTLLIAAVGLASCAADDASDGLGDDASLDSGDTTGDVAPDAVLDGSGGTDAGSDASPVDDAQSDAQEYEDRYVVCETIAVPTRFDAGWERMNHRISRLGFLPATDADPCAPDRWDVSFVGGDFTTGGVATDDAEIVFDWTQVALAPGGAMALVVPVELTVPAGGFAQGRVSLQLDDPRFDGLNRVVALVGGFLLETDVAQGPEYPDAYDPALGYTSRGYGMGVSSARDADVVHVDWELRFEHGITFDAFIRPDMNAAIPHAVTSARLDVIVIAYAEADAVASGAIDWLQKTDVPYRATEEREPDLPEAARTVTLPGRLGAGAEFVGLAAFDFRLYPDMTCSSDTDCDMDDPCGEDGVCEQRTGPPGDYVRQLAAGVEPREGLLPDGSREVLVTGYASTASEAFAFRPLHNNFSARVVRALLGDGPRYRYLATQPTGTRTISLDDVEER